MEILIQYGIQLAWVFLEVLSLYLFADSFLPRRQGKLWCGLFFLLVGGLGGTYICLGLDQVYLLPVAAGLAAAGSFLAFRGRWWQHILVVILSVGFSLAVDAMICCGAIWVLGVRFSELVWQQMMYYVVLTTAKMMTLFVAYLIHRFRMPNASRFVFSKGLFLTLLFPGISLIIIMLAFNIYRSGADLSSSIILTCGILAAANVTVLYLVHTMEKTGKTDTELVLLNKQMEIQTQSILSLEKSYRAQRKAAHEFRHHLQTLRDLLDQGQTDAARRYIAQLQDTSSTRILCVNTRHPIMDAILNQKYQAAAEQSIDMQLQVNDLSGLTVDPEALVVVLTNLLDNAIEACERLPDDRSIYCSMLLNESLFISVRNTALPVKIEKKTIPTSKMPREEHGYGLPSICSILDKLEAEYAFDYEDGWFRFVAEIPLR